ncbi:PP2C family protein-serine/threonine phosphatase [Streptomyces sp. NPDC059985]|uniref:PP2C family protein-serine/threonine phosphatase n=1 Tax=Streptomyces sp. NPDC059985 TaxID=3347025 RepID=UPI003696D0BF
MSSEIALRQALRESRASGQASAAPARTLQDSLLPPRLPDAPGLDVAAVHLPADATGDAGSDVVGDFYDLFHTRGKNWAAVMGDVCGKGIDAALVTALARYTVRAEAGQHTHPSVILHRLHQAMANQRVSGRFLTVALTTFRPAADGMGLLGRYAGAGHPPALIRRADGTVEELAAPGMFLHPDIAPDQALRGDTNYQLLPGDALLLYTDGITEARTRDRGPLFGDECLAEVLADTHPRPGRPRHLGPPPAGSRPTLRRLRRRRHGPHAPARHPTVLNHPTGGPMNAPAPAPPSSRCHDQAQDVERQLRELGISPARGHDQ